MSEIKLKKYFENMPYGENSLASEVHGPRNQETINNIVKELVEMYDYNMSIGEKGKATDAENTIKHLSKQLENLKSIKEEYALNMGGGARGKKLFSNWTDTTWEDFFFTEKGVIDVDENFDIICDVPGLSHPYKKIEDITEEWEVIGDWMMKFHDAKRELSTSSNSLKPPSFDADFFVHNLLKENWRSMLTDEMPGGGYFLQNWLAENVDQSGDVMNQLVNLGDRLDKQSFNPDKDTRLHDYYARILKTANDPNYLTAAESNLADNLMRKTNNKNRLFPNKIV